MTIKRILYRFKQYRQAVKSNLTFSDVEFVRQYLTKPEQVLFYRMRVFDQKHALLMAQKFLSKQEGYSWVDKPKFMRAALMHDIGKAYVGIPLYIRGLFVVLSNINDGALLARYAKQDAKFEVWKYLYVMLHHGEIGAKMLEEIEDDKEIVQVARFHHQKPEPKESALLPIVRELDNQI